MHTYKHNGKILFCFVWVCIFTILFFSSPFHLVIYFRDVSRSIILTSVFLRLLYSVCVCVMCRICYILFSLSFVDCHPLCSFKQRCHEWWAVTSFWGSVLAFCLSGGLLSSPLPFDKDRSLGLLDWDLLGTLHPHNNNSSTLLSELGFFR